MKKLLSILLASALLLGCAGASAFAGEAEPAFADSIEAQAFAVAMAYHEGSYADGVTPADPDFLWDATGWYAAWLYRTEHIDLLEEADVHDFQRSLGSRDTEPMAVEWLINAHGVRFLRRSDGGHSYDFARQKARMDEVLGQTLAFYLDAPAFPEATVTLRRYDSRNAQSERRYALSFTRNRDAGSAFPYSLRNVEAPASGPAWDTELDFDWDGLLAANSLENILSVFSSVRIDHTYDGGVPTWIFRKNGNLCILRAGETYTGGQYRGCYFDYEQGEDGKMRARISAFDPAAGNPEMQDGYINDYLQGASSVSLDRIDGDLIRTHFTYVGDWLQDVAFDRGILVLREMVHTIDEETEPIVNTFTYSGETPAFPFLDSWDEPLRHVTLVWEDWYTGEARVRTETVEVPVDWEYIPWEGRWGDYTIYMNEDYTQPYAYPGDGADYTLYLTTAKG